MNKRSKKLGINFDLKFKDIKNVNPSFDSAKIAIAYTGRNRNMSSISKEAFEAALPTIKNVPLVGRYIEDEDDFGAHDIRVVVKGDEFDVQNATVPFGVVPESASQWWEQVTEEDGTVRDYLFTDCLLWKRQPGYACLAKQEKWHQSMEIDLNKYVVDSDGYCVIEDFVYTAFCILGNSVEPCFESASVQLTSDAAVSVYKQQFSLMLEDLKNEFGTQETNFNQEEEPKMLTNEVIEAILAEFNVKLEDLSFEVTENMTEEELREKLTAAVEPTEDPVEEPADEPVEDPVEEPVEDPAEPPVEDPVEEPAGEPTEDSAETSVESENFSSTYEQRRQAIQNALPCDENTYSWLMDFDDTYAYFEMHVWHDGEVTESHNRVSYMIDSSSMTASIGTEYEPIVCKWLTMEENARIEADRDLLAELQAFRDERLTAEHHDAIDAVLAEFEDLSENTEFVALCERAYDFENVEDLKKECYAIRGKFAIVKPKENNKTSVKVPIGGVQDKKNDPVGDLFARYGKK